MSSDERRTELECVDFISQFYPSYPPIIAQIFSYLTPNQLCIISCVCKKWRKACKTDTKARKRKINYLRMIKKLRKSVGEENWPIQQKRTVVTAHTTHTTETTAAVSLETRTPLKSVINVHQTFIKSSAISSHLTNTINKDIGSRTTR